MKQFTGGVVVKAGRVQVDLQIAGGRVQSRIYCDDVQPAIDKLVIIDRALTELELTSTDDAVFYVRELSSLLQPTHLDLLPMVGSYQIVHNITAIGVYVRACLALFSTKEALQLLNCARMETELNADCDTSLGDMAVDNDADYRSSEPIDCTTDIITAIKELRQLFSKYVQTIATERENLQTAYRRQIDQIRRRLAP
jgi:hypothetical protein